MQTAMRSTLNAMPTKLRKKDDKGICNFQDKTWNHVCILYDKVREGSKVLGKEEGRYRDRVRAEPENAHILVPPVATAVRTGPR